MEMAPSRGSTQLEVVPEQNWHLALGSICASRYGTQVEVTSKQRQHPSRGGTQVKVALV